MEHATANCLARGWSSRLSDVLATAQDELLIASPYVTMEGAEFIIRKSSTKLRQSGTVRFLTDLSPLNIARGSTDPESLRRLSECMKSTETTHLPRLHAKVYVVDDGMAIISSANLTAGGLYNNYEYGVCVTDILAVSRIRSDLLSYSTLGAKLLPSDIDAFCNLAIRVRETYRKQLESASRSIRQQFDSAIRETHEQLIRLRLAGGKMHTVFSSTVLYLLGSIGPMITTELHKRIEAIHPDLCDNSVDRVIDGKRFGKRWKHAVRTAQQHLKKHGVIRLVGNTWSLVK